MNENTFVDSLFFRFYLLLSHCFSFLSALCLLSHLEIIRYIMKSMIANSMYFLLKYNWKKKTWKVFFGQPSFGTQTGIAVSQTAWIYQCKHLYFFYKCKLYGSFNSCRKHGKGSSKFGEADFESIYWEGMHGKGS